MNTLDTTSPELVSVNPATNEPVGTLQVTPVEALPEIIARSSAAQKQWAKRSIEHRADTLRPAGARLLAEAERIGELLTREMGKPLAEGVGEVTYAAKNWSEEIDEIVAALQPEVLEDDDRLTRLYFDPLGVCGAITPWNFPVLMPHQAVLAGLIAGNSVVLKPSEETPLVAQAYCDVINELLPADLLQVIHGNEVQGRALVSSDVDLIVFTGSKSAGEHILGSASQGLKRVILELGGKDPMVVLKDADIDAAVAFGVRNAFRNAGQVCVSTERIYVDDAIHDDFVRRFVAKTAELQQGDGMNEGVNIGPMISATQKALVVEQLNEAIADGAVVAHGGGEGDGNFVPLTVLTGLNHDMRIMNDETFGPIACIQRTMSDEEAIELANDTPYGLGACVFGEVEHATSVARHIQAGMVGVNSGCGGASGSPWVGAKHSGYGFHSGKLGHRQFCQVRTVSVPK
ncbi:MAG: aldehyde dehydrogenase family protein [Planctomycetota bacterium]|nr:aldehyde dehydrogenase family protein [Planctomycetota bacterium]